MTCFHLLKIASDGDFNLLFCRKLLAFSKLASAKFDPCSHNTSKDDGFCVVFSRILKNVISVIVHRVG